MVSNSCELGISDTCQCTTPGQGTAGVNLQSFLRPSFAKASYEETIIRKNFFFILTLYHFDKFDWNIYLWLDSYSTMASVALTEVLLTVPRQTNVTPIFLGQKILSAKAAGIQEIQTHVVSLKSLLRNGFTLICFLCQ